MLLGRGIVNIYNIPRPCRYSPMLTPIVADLGDLKAVPFVFHPCSLPYFLLSQRDVGHLETRLDETS
jgi:hypothetical protein